jgi:hypothetical protein
MTMSKLESIKLVTSENKDTFHNSGKRQLKKLAKSLGLTDKDFEVRSCYGGTEVAGEVILHTDKFYMQIFQEAVNPKGLRIMYRDCKGRTDYKGGPNRYERIENLFGERFIEALKKMQARELD